VPSFYTVFQRLSEWRQPVPAAVVSGDTTEKIQTGD
jgi:hypothetical protein